MFSVFKNPEYTTAESKIVDVLNDVLDPNELQIVLQEAPLMEATQLYCQGFKYFNYIGYERWAQRLGHRLNSASPDECLQACQMLMGVFSVIKEATKSDDLDFVYATWDLPTFAEYASQNLNKEQSQTIVEFLVMRFGMFFGNSTINNNLDFTSQWNRIVSIANVLNVDCSEIIKKRSVWSSMTNETVVGLYEYYNWEETTFPSTVLDNLFKREPEENVKKAVNNLPVSLLTENNGSLLYRVLRNSDLFNEYSMVQQPLVGISALLKHIDFEKCLKKRFPDVSVKERLEVASSLVPFLSPDEQERLFELLEDSLAQTKNKTDVKKLKNTETEKAKSFKEHWNATNFRKTIKNEVEKVSVPTETKKRKM